MAYATFNGSTIRPDRPPPIKSVEQSVVRMNGVPLSDLFVACGLGLWPQNDIRLIPGAGKPAHQKLLDRSSQPETDVDVDSTGS